MKLLKAMGIALIPFVGAALMSGIIISMMEAGWSFLRIFLAIVVAIYVLVVVILYFHIKARQALDGKEITK